MPLSDKEDFNLEQFLDKQKPAIARKSIFEISRQFQSVDHTVKDMAYDYASDYTTRYAKRKVLEKVQKEASEGTVKIFKDKKTVRFSDWTIWRSNGETMLTVTYLSGKKYTEPLTSWKIEPEIEKGKGVFYDRKNQCYQNYAGAKVLGGKYALISYEGNDAVVIRKADEIEFDRETGWDPEKTEVYSYFKNIALEREELAKTSEDKLIAKNIVSQFKKLPLVRETALEAYISGKVQERTEKRELIYPFGINQTQMESVKAAFASQVSIIEGPPGTGKTQTILNIISNIIVSGQTCAVVSNNNSAVENVYEKLEEEGVDCFVAKLGNTQKQEEFFENLHYRKPDLEKEIALEEVLKYIENVSGNLETQNELSKIKSLIDEAEIEKKYLEEWFEEHPEIQVRNADKHRITQKKAMDMLIYLKRLDEDMIGVKERLELLFRFGIFRASFLKDMSERENFIFSLQHTYYDKLVERMQKQKAALEERLKTAGFKDDMEALQRYSMLYLKSFISQNSPDQEPEFDKENYKKRFPEFLKYFPVIGSSTHSLVNSAGNGCVFDYVIIDEASQQDIVPGVLCLGCAKNAVIVGDKKQLSHIPCRTKTVSPKPEYDCIKNSLLDSVDQVFGKEVPRTLLREHYRCHPRIIQFCNREFYDNELIPMKEDHGEKALSLVITAKGNHMRNNQNLREIESVLETQEVCGYLGEGEGEVSRGFIAPFNAQVNLARSIIPESVVKNTIHKFQGRGCDEIIFSTVLDKKASSQSRLDFVDNAEMVNVAVSRAKNKFTLVTGNDVFKKNKYIAALIRYMKYYASDEVYDSPVISAFDLLYDEYDESLKALEAKLNPKDSKFRSEQIASALLREILKQEEFRAFKFNRQIYLKQIVSEKNIDLIQEEKQFIRTTAHCDIVIFYKQGKTPVGVIEIDGGYHNTKAQKERDRKKDSILKKAGIKELRLRTIDSEIRRKMEEFLRYCLGG